MKTKRIVSLILVAVLMLGTLALTSCGKSAKYTVGICQLVQHPALDAATQGFKDALIAELGEENVKFDEQNASNDVALCRTIADNFVASDVDLILANATPALQAASQATKKIPILGTSVTEYGVALGLENFSGTVGGNISGTSDLASLADQAQMVVDLVPGATKVGLLYCSAEDNSLYQVNVVKAELEKKGLTCTTYPFTDSNDVNMFAKQAAAENDVIYVPTDNTVAENAAAIYNAMSPKKPIIAGEEGICSGCGIATLSISYYELGVATGKMAAKILKGEAQIATMPIEYAPSATKKYNKKICEDLGFNTADLEAKGYVAIAE